MKMFVMPFALDDFGLSLINFFSYVDATSISSMIYPMIFRSFEFK